MSVLQPIREKVIWRTRMDERSCVECRSLNGKIFTGNEGTRPPLHDNCRCRVMKYTPKPRPKHVVYASQDPAVVGPAYWQVLFNQAYNLPDHVSNNERLRFRQRMQDLVKTFPCSDCVTDAVAWMHSNKLEGENRNDFLEYLCNMKNFVNSKTNKPIYDCSSLLTTDSSMSTSETMTHNPRTHNQTCNQCDSHPGEEESESEHNPEPSTTFSEEGLIITPDLVSSKSKNEQQNRNHDSVVDLKSRLSNQTHELYKSFKDYKSLSKRIVDNLCKTYNIPTPYIVFDKCPDGSGKSCTVGNKTIYLDPNQYSARTLLHEFIHYAANHRGHTELDVDEASIDKIAQGIINKSFKSTRNYGSGMGLIRHDTRGFVTPEIQKRSTSLLDNWKFEFPLLQKAMNYDPNTAVVMGPNGAPATAVYPQQPTAGGPAGSGIVAPQPQIIQDPKDDPSTGLMSMFDNVYTPFANLLGLSARDINESHTPSIIQNAVTTLAEANMSDLGAVSVSLLSSIVLFGIGILGKDHIVVGDRKLMSEMGAGFLWNSMRYVGNPKTMDTINDDAKNLGEALSKWNTDQSLKIITTDKRDMRKPQQMKRMMESRRKMMGGGEYLGGGEDGDVIYSKSGPNGPSESAFSDDERMAMGMGGGPMLFTADGGRSTRVLVGSDGKTIMKTLNRPENRGADIKGLIGTTQNENPYNRQSPFTFVGGSAVGQGEPDRRPHKPKRMNSGEYMMDDLDGDFVPQEYEHFYRPQQSFPNVSIT